MPAVIERPTRIQAAGTMPKLIDEYIGRVNTPAGSGNSSGQQSPQISVAHMRSPAGWTEPGQTPEFEEYTLVLRGRLHVRHKSGTLQVAAGQAIITHPGEWVQYSTPEEPTEYIAICLPAFSPETVHRDPQK